jgi:hypothetical protein
MKGSDNSSSFATTIGIGIIILFILGLGIYTYYKIKRDVALYREIKNDEENGKATSGTNGDPGVPGRDAFEIYKEKYGPSTLTYEEYLALFVGKDGEDGIDAASALDGSHGSDGSTGDQGPDGLDGVKGEPGIPGQKGIPGDSFFTYNSLTKDEDTGDNLILQKLASYAVVENFSGDSTAIIKYTFKGNLLTTMNISWVKKGGSTYPDAYLSVILYQNGQIIGMTDPITMFQHDETNNISFTATNSDLEYRMLISFCRSRVQSTPTMNIFEKTLNNEAYTFEQKSTVDTYSQTFYDIISQDSSLAGTPYEYLERVFLTSCQSAPDPFSLESLYESFPPAD